SGLADCIIAGGVECMSPIPFGGWRIVPNYEVAASNPEWYWSMGLTAEAVAREFKVSREAQDVFALSSHHKAISAIKNNLFKDEIVPVEIKEVYLDAKEKKAERTVVVDTDEGPRADTTAEKLAALKHVFDAKGTVTAGNSSQTSDGASLVLVVSEAVLKRAGMKQDDIQLIELNEAFASQSLAVINTLGLNPDIVNVNGGAIALGHPLGCTGSKLTVQLLNEMRRRKLKYGMVTMCVGNGQGAAGIFEFLN